MTVNQSDVELWVPPYEGALMEHQDVVRHMAFLKAENPEKGWEKLSRPYGFKKNRCWEIMSDPDTTLGYDYLHEVTLNATRFYPGGVPMLKGYTVKATGTKDDLDRAFGPRSEPAKQQKLMPIPTVIAPEVGMAVAKVLGDPDFDPENEDNSAEDFLAYISRMEARISQLDSQLAQYQRGVGPLHMEIKGLRDQLLEFSKMNAQKDKVIEGLNATVRGLTRDLLEAQKFVGAYNRLRDLLRGIVSDDN